MMDYMWFSQQCPLTFLTFILLLHSAMTTTSVVKYHLHIYLGQGRPYDGLADHKDNLHTGRERNHNNGHRVIDGRQRCVCEGCVRAHVHLACAEDKQGNLQAESGHSSLPQVYWRTRHLRL